VLLTKCDKLSRSAGLMQLRGLQKALTEMSPEFTCQLFSSPDKLGVDEARKAIAAWMG
jgi:GTP-binding protein